MKCWPQSAWGGKGSFGLHVQVTGHHWRKSGHKPKREQRWGRRGQRLTAMFLVACLAYFLYNQDHLPRAAPPIVGCALPINKQWRNVPEICPQASWMEIIPQLRVPPPKYIQCYVRLTKTNWQCHHRPEGEVSSLAHFPFNHSWLWHKDTEERTMITVKFLL